MTRPKIVLTKETIRAVLKEHSVKHTPECRAKPGNVKGDGGHGARVRADGKVDLGGYRCICDWSERVAALARPKKPEPVRVLKTACSSCPYRKDTPSGVWSAAEYEKLRLYDEGRAVQVPDGAGGTVGVKLPEIAMFLCHHTNATGEPTACRGWLSVHRDHTATRFACVMGGLREEDIPTEDESSMYYASGTEACEAGLRDVENPSQEALGVVHKLIMRGAGHLSEEEDEDDD